MENRKIIEVISIIKKAKYNAYLVGGSSRDLLYCRDFDDIDIATNAPLDFIKKTFKVKDNQGEKMGSVKITYKNTIMEITRFREDLYNKKTIYPEKVKFVNTPIEDAKRRDFTINAIYIDLTTNQLIDQYDGLKDLMAFQIKFIGDPKERIIEDPTRILRGIRLAYKLNFTIEENTKKAFIDNINELERISNNKYQKLILKMVEELGETKTARILQEYHLGRESYEHQ